MLAAGHGHRTADVLLFVELRRDGVARAPGPIAFGIAPLDDEVRHDAVKGQAVVEALLGQSDEVLHRLGGVGRKELHPDLPALLERDDRCLLHPVLLA
jgi:hypothetical protein